LKERLFCFYVCNDILINIGVEDTLSKQAALQISRNKDRWADFMMKLELEIEKPSKNRAAMSAATIAVSYLAGGFIPLFPYIVIKDSKTGFYLSCLITVCALLVFGYFKSKVGGQPLIKGTLKAALTGIVAATAAYLYIKNTRKADV
jgi:predicted membrane protein (TIGR00267 family)